MAAEAWQGTRSWRALIRGVALALRHFRRNGDMTSPLQTGRDTAESLDEQRSRSPQVSILCVTYKQERFVLDAVRSLLQQNYSPLDIVILDDASPDATADIISAELGRHPHRTDIRFIRNEQNLGARGNILKGLALAKGEFIILSCGDDIMLPTRVEKMVKVWREEKVSLVATNAIYIDESSAELDRFYRRPGEPYDETFETLARDGGNALCFGASLGFERRLFDEAGWPRGHPTVLDIMLPFSAYLANGARFIPEPLLKYRVNSQNTSLSLAAEMSSGIDKLTIEFEIFCCHLEQSFLMEAELDRLNRANPVRFHKIARRIKPLVAVQTSEMARKLVRTRAELRKLGVTRLIGEKPKSTAQD
jgi:glycosyltransferase involved in cell wall biosynthesis